MRRDGWRLGGVLAALLGLAATVVPLTATPAPAAEIVIKAITAWPLDCNCVSQYKRYIEEVNKRGKGKVEVRFLGGPEVVKLFEQFQALRTGIADMTHTAPGYFVGETIEGGVFELVDPTDFGKVLKGFRGTDAIEVINQAYREKSGVRFLAITVGGTRFRFMMGKPINGLEDLKGKRIRVFGSQTAKVTQHFGASPQTIPPAELYPALQRGVVDGAIRAPDDAWSFGERDVYKSMIATPIQLAPGGTFIATRVWDKLPQDVQQLLTSVAIELEPQVLRYFGDSDDRAIENLKAKGMRVIEIGPADQKRLVEARNLYWEDVVAKSPSHGGRLRTILEAYTR
jgi:TRAP-type C4-dicarboxylate transport system substrate-binding protein